MGQLTCQRCGAISEGKSFEEADELIDHAIGQSIGRPCSGKTDDLVWNTKYVEAESDTDSDISTSKKTPKRR